MAAKLNKPGAARGACSASSASLLQILLKKQAQDGSELGLKDPFSSCTSLLKKCPVYQEPQTNPSQNTFLTNRWLWTTFH